MELYYKNLYSLKECFQNYKFEDIMSLENKEIRYLCAEQKQKVILQLFSQDFSNINIINERLKKNEKENDPAGDKLKQEPAEKFFIGK